MTGNKTQMFRPKPMRAATLLVLDSRRELLVYSLAGNTTLGREYPESDRNIRVRSEIVGRRHGEFVYDDSADTYYYIDNNSLNGTFVNGVKLQPYNQRGSKAVRLQDGDVIRIDRSDLSHPHPQAVLMIFSRSMEKNEKWQAADVTQQFRVSVGRDASNTIRLNDPMASRSHAEIYFTDKGVLIYDNNSSNGVFVNGRRVGQNAPLHPNDVIRIANTMLIFTGSHLFFNNPGDRTGCLSVNLRDKTVRNGFKQKTLLRDISFEADASDFILILGGSGAGKTTLIKAILGDGKANGEVLLNGRNLYENFNELKSQIGLVPQFITLRKNDKTYATLMDFADIRLSDMTKEEKRQRVDAILEKLGIANLKNHLICQLSGGQMKKVSVAAQMVGYQKVFICDEPDSGLDAASRQQQMEILSSIASSGDETHVGGKMMLEELAQSGKIVMVISHEPDDAMDQQTGRYLFTKVLVLAKSSVDNCGRLAFYGDPDAALQFFGVKRLQDIMVEINPPHEGGKGRADYYINKYHGGGA